LKGSLAQAVGDNEEASKAVADALAKATEYERLLKEQMDRTNLYQEALRTAESKEAARVEERQRQEDRIRHLSSENERISAAVSQTKPSPPASGVVASLLVL
jgi:chromosome segregation ATPase